MPGIGELAPDFSDRDVRTDATFTLSERTGEIVVLTFSGLCWCGACQMKMPMLQQL
jgi:thiol-disulfide isomerase/thioredoxin